MERPSPIALLAVLFAALAGAAGVVVAAWAAHGLGGTAPLAQTASLYALVHAPAMIGAAMLLDRIAGTWPRRLVALALILFAAGIVLFSGGLVFAAIGIATGTAPFGGVALIAAWAALAAAALIALAAPR